MENLQSTIRKYLVDLENLTIEAMKTLFKQQSLSGQTFDDRIEEHFITRAQSW